MSICNLLASDREKKGKKNRTFNSLCWQHLTQVDSTCKRSVFQVQRLQRELSSFNGSSRGTDGPAASSQSPAAPSVLPVVPPAATPPGNNGWGWSNPRTDRQRGQPNENQNQTKTEQNQLKPTQTISCSQLESTKHCCGSQCIGLHFPSKSTVWLWVCTVAFVISRCVCVCPFRVFWRNRVNQVYRQDFRHDTWCKGSVRTVWPVAEVGKEIIQCESGRRGMGAGNYLNLHINIHVYIYIINWI